ncbi:hypothetical protein [Sphingomonas sp. Leaf343]|uniref:hypothetical protein n=1 Tax=Sphingomonas sp. Leaf343 TaxID=1736345 RepID=UPI000701968B|nr:hypothetical protein [Sphingomonas sp. Leaf343]KQR82169.1 hypothetical protein ASG07_10775 [Sphingomonas sp. Leaf343]
MPDEAERETRDEGAGKVRDRPRTNYPQVPPWVEQSLSGIGLALSPSIEALIDRAFMRRQAEGSG